MSTTTCRIVPLHPGRNDGLKIQLKNEDALVEGFVLTQIYLFEKNVLHQVTTASSGDVVLDDSVVMLDDAEADVKLACVGDGRLFLKSLSNATLSSLDVEVMGNGLVQLEIPSVNLDRKLDVEVAGTGVVALITDDLSAHEVKCTLSGSGDIVVDTGYLEARKLHASVYGSGIASFATTGSVEKESLTLSGSGQLLAGSIVAAESNVDVWGNGEMLVQVTDKLTVLTSVWGKVGYVNAPPAEVKVKGWWFWRETSSIVYSAAVNKVAMFEPLAVPAKTPVYYSIKTMKSLLSDEPNCTSLSSETSEWADLMSMSLSKVQQTDATLTDAISTDAHSVFYALVGVVVVAVNVVAARSWSERRARRHYTSLL
uniref:Putative auto-transporter adhesin head GIN domain-containing protein n=1 Tax=Peronospora matthiolae TaxID=2874970 RepID=A0AAV1TMQ4_9STRA